MTRRDVADTRHDVRATRRDGDLPPTSNVLLRLPSGLADRFTVVAELAAQGAEADVLRVKDDDGREFVVKLYRSGFTVDPAVREKLACLDPSHVVRNYDTGNSDGRYFELLEFVAGGSLETGYRRGNGMPELSITEVVRQLAAALTHLHDAGIIHRDLKPANVLVRSHQPLDLVLADFGLSRYLDVSVAFLSASRTLAYAPPDSLSNRVSPAWDWWSLGMIVRELATGEKPFEGMNDEAVVHHLSTRDIDLDSVRDTRLRLLCHGLLTRDPDSRWGAEEVREWLAGGSPQVAAATLAGAGSHGRSLRFLGRAYTDRKALARAFAKQWETAARRHFTAMGTLDQPSEEWGCLRGWLRELDGDVEGRGELIRGYLEADGTPHEKLLRLLLWLDPTMPPCYRGLRMLREDLAAVADRAARHHTDAAYEVVCDLWEQRLLLVLAQFSGGQELTEVDDRWRSLVQRWPSEREWAREVPQQAAAALSGAVVRCRLLASAAEPDQAGRWLQEGARKAADAVGRRVLWFHHLSATAGADPIRLLAVILTAGYAFDEAERATAAHRRWEEAETARLQGQVAATRWALLGGGLLLLTGLMYRSALLGTRSPATTVVMLVVVGVQVWGEVSVARQLAGDYHPRWSLLGLAQRVTGPALRAVRAGLTAASGPIRERPIVGALGAGCLIWVLLWVLGALVQQLLGLWLMLLVLTAPLYLLWCRRRTQAWRIEHEQRRRQLMGE